jgi:glycosyltransferase involved in cell wall biosynthesis
MHFPQVSIVMSVHNEGETLRETLHGILGQEGVDLEFIVVNDGSTDNTAQILEDAARNDGRLRVISKSRQGLTQALIDGCAAARGMFIARQDGGDVSLPGRLAHQVEAFRRDPRIVMTACGTRTVGPAGEPLQEVFHDGAALQTLLLAEDAARLRGPSHHGAVMFRRDTYRRVGGYRAAFPVAQDLDLWRRMAEIGRCEGTAAVLYHARLRRGSISQARRRQQTAAKDLILRSSAARRKGEDDAAILQEAQALRSGRQDRSLFATRVSDARFYYFVGSLLRARQRRQSRSYYLKALRSWPVLPRAWYGLLSTMAG